MTLLEIVNSVLLRMRYNEASSVTDSSYTKLLREYVNDTKREVEDAWPWLSLRATIQIDTVADVFRYTMSGVGQRSKLLKNEFGEADVFNETNQTHLRKAPSMRWMTTRLNDDNPSKNEPSYFDFNGVSNGDLLVDLWPIPDNVYTLNFNMVVPQDDLVNDADNLIVPSRLVLLGTWARALEDRGESGGNSGVSAWRHYHEAFADALAVDNNNSADSEQLWTVV